MKKGIDVSYHNGIIDWKRVKQAGIDFAIIRLGYRTTLDTQALYNIREAKKNGINVGVYWFLYWDRATIEQNAEACAKYLSVAELSIVETNLFTDLEYDAFNKAAETCTKQKCSAYLAQFIEALKKQGIKKIGIYCNNDYFKNYIDWNKFNGYPVWLADYNGGADYDCIIQQYSSSGRVDGIDGDVDMNYLMQDDFFSVSDTKQEETKMTEQELRQSVVNYLKKYVGITEGSAGHKAILKMFNDSHLCTRYTMTQYDAWCATAVSAAFIANGLAGKAGSGSLCEFVECSCWYMIELAKKQGIWHHGKIRDVQVGDVIMYDWNADTVADHVGIVSAVNSNGITIIEGNKNDSVSYREIGFDYAYIRGYIKPMYSKYANKVAKNEDTKSQEDLYDFTTKSGKNISKSRLYFGEVTSETLNVRKAPDVSASTCSFSPLKKGTQIEVCDEMRNGWLYIKHNGLYGFVSGQYVVKEGEKQPVAEKTATNFTAKDKSKFTISAKGTPNVTEKAVAKITASALNVRTWAGTEFPNIKSYPILEYGNLVSVCDSIADSDGDTWLYVKIADKWYGFISADYVEIQ